VLQRHDLWNYSRCSCRYLYVEGKGDLMAIDYGTDVGAIDDLPDPEFLVSGDLNMAYALARRLMTPTGALDDIGDPGPYDSIDVRDWLGRATDQDAIDELQQFATQVIVQDERVDSATVTVTFQSPGTLFVSVDGQGAVGPFKFVLAVTNVSAQLLRGS
jgi:hypothetical protein